MTKEKNTGELEVDDRPDQIEADQVDQISCDTDTLDAREYFRPPLPSRATRNVLKPSRNSSRGFLILKFPSDEWPRKYTYESILEKCFLVLMWLSADVHLIQEQPPFINYVDDQGRTKKHIFDFLVLLLNGQKIAVAIKPASRAEKLNFERELELVASAMPKTFADRVLLLTDKDLNKTAANAALRELMLTDRSMIGGAK